MAVNRFVRCFGAIRRWDNTETTLDERWRSSTVLDVMQVVILFLVAFQSDRADNVNTVSGQSDQDQTKPSVKSRHSEDDTTRTKQNQTKPSVKSRQSSVGCVILISTTHQYSAKRQIYHQVLILCIHK
jgi:hypothetical protein